MSALLDQINDIESDIFSLTTLLFSLLAIAVFCHFLRRRYLLRGEIKNISKDDLMKPCYQNHLKNLQIKLMITNFVIIIVFVEFMFNLSLAGRALPKWKDTFKENIFSFQDLKKASLTLRYIGIITVYCHIVIPCLLLKVLLLAYFHCPHRYTVMRWSIYITVRCVVFVGSFFINSKIYTKELRSLRDILGSVAFFADFFTYIIYSRRFYLHLKSREKEARLFKDRTTYLNERAICIHFKVASILVTIALFALLFPQMIYPVINIPGIYIAHYNEEIYKIMESTIKAVENIGYIIYSLVFILNYLYMISLVVGSYLMQKRGLVHVNKKIKPIITAYHKSPHFARNFNP